MGITRPIGEKHLLARGHPTRGSKGEQTFGVGNRLLRVNCRRHEQEGGQSGKFGHLVGCKWAAVPLRLRSIIFGYHAYNGSDE